MGGFDTHEGTANQLSTQQEFANALSVFIQDLNNSPDPANPSLPLAQTTTVLITSEFVRTPKLNLTGGTDHWPSASAILLGKGIKDNHVVGGTDQDGHAMGIENGSLVARSSTNLIAPEDLAKTVLVNLGQTALGNSYTSRNPLDVLED